MTRMRLCQIVVTLAAVAPAAQARAVPDRTAIFCAELERVIQAIDLGDPTALERSRARPPGFGFRYGCGAQGRGWFCHQSLAPPGLSLNGLAESVSQCRPDLVRDGSSAPDHILFEGFGVRILIMESGAPRAHVGRIVTFSIEHRAKAQPQPGQR